MKVLIAKFVKDRNWEKFHIPPNLAKSICIESAELLEIFQWNHYNRYSMVNEVQLGRLKEELADVLIYCISMANALKIDIARSVSDKIKKNKLKYPIAEENGT